MNKFYVWVRGKSAGTIWAWDEEDACARLAKRCGIPVELVSAQAVIRE